QSELGKIDEYIGDMETAGIKIGNLQQTVSGIDVAQLRTTLDTQSGNVDSTRDILRQFRSDYASFKTDIDTANAELDEADTKLSEYEDDVSVQIVLLQGYRDQVASYENDLDELANNPLLPNELKTEVIQMRNEVQQTRQDLDNSINGLQSVKEDIAESQQMLESIRQKLGLAEARLDAEKNSMDQMGSTLNSTTDDLAAMNSQVASLTQTIDEVNALTTEANATKDEISEKLQNSKVMLENFMGTLGTLSDINPKFLSHPIQAFEKNLYEKITPLTFITPISLGLVLLLTCLLLTSVSVITEKREGAHLRMKLSSTTSSTLIIGKIIGQMVFAFIVSGIILSIGFFVFNVQFQQNALEIALAIAIASFSFISLGLFITNFAKTQSTAVLGSLILILPMIFLSGTILPLQLMNPVLQMVSEFLPLTAANILLSGALIKGIPLIEMIKPVAILLIPGAILTAFSIKKF
ncbi:MAG: ABC transporter permease, partial [archaeon]|nr:ABC transporter permease [archaeon]